MFAIGILLKSIPLLFIARSFAGLTGGNVSVAQAAIADITKPENRARNFGLIGAAFGLGFILGPYIGGKLSAPNEALIQIGNLHLLTTPSWFTTATPFWFAAGLSFLNVLFVLFFLPETLQHPNTDLKLSPLQALVNIAKAYSIPGIRTLYTTNFLFQAGFTFFTTFTSVFLIDRFSFTQGNIGDFFSYIGIWVAFTQIVITRQISSRLSSSAILRFSIIASGIFVLMYFLPKIWWQLLLITPFFAIANGLTQANMTGLISSSADRSVQGEVLGINSSVQALAQTIPPILSGYIAAKLTPETPILVSGVVIIIAGLFYNILYRPTKVTTTATAVA